MHEVNAKSMPISTPISLKRALSSRVSAKRGDHRPAFSRGACRERREWVPAWTEIAGSVATILVCATLGCGDAADSGTGTEQATNGAVATGEHTTVIATDGVEQRLGLAVDEVRVALGSALKAALADGPETAIDVCRVEAPRLAQQASTDEITVGRTSHRLRNPANAPETWMLPFIAEFQALDAAPGRSRTVDLGARGTGYVEAIYTQPLCLTCHGENVDPALLKKIREHYPDDAATGFRAGELRGLFWAVGAKKAL
jgi:hypothetical protein